jgi:hypothetical protein
MHIFAIFAKDLTHENDPRVENSDVIFNHTLYHTFKEACIRLNRKITFNCTINEMSDEDGKEVVCHVLSVFVKNREHDPKKKHICFIIKKGVLTDRNVHVCRQLVFTETDNHPPFIVVELMNTILAPKAMSGSFIDTIVAEGERIKILNSDN